MEEKNEVKNQGSIDSGSTSILNGRKEKKSLSPVLAFVCLAFLMLVSEIVSVLLIDPAVSAHLSAFTNPESVLNIIFYLILFLVVTTLLILLIRKKIHWLLSLILAFCIGLVLYYVAFALLSLIPSLSSTLISLFSIFFAVAGILILYFLSEWYVIDILGIIIAAGCAVIFGISLSPLLVVILLILLIIYDYISVNYTKHMLTLADGIMKQKMPIMFLIPKYRGYSYRKSDFSISKPKNERETYMIGMGDMIMPSILVVSSQFFIDAPMIFGLTLPAFGTMIGSLIGIFLIALPLHKSGKAQAGMPFINTGAILGFFICCSLSGSWSWLMATFFG